MTRILKSAAGSYEGWNVMPDQPRVCDVCGEKVTLRGLQPLWFDTLHRKTYHVYCRVGS